MLKVWGRRSSFNVQKVLWLVGELGLAHEHIPAGGDFGRLDEPAFRMLNPHERVPVIEDGDLAVWESQAILRYLAARYGRGRFWSDDPAERSQVDRWMDWSQTALQPDFLNGVFWGYYRTPEAQRNATAIAKSIARCAAHFRRLDSVLATRPFLCGDQLSLADIPAGTSLYRYFELDLEIERPDVPHVVAWYQRLQERPAYREHVMVPFGELRGRLDY
ncbi:MAG TPA: glutathione S-transferase [Vineibacter sp.]|nr:glutathione S-transferase [Vineibacter sp.]